MPKSKAGFQLGIVNPLTLVGNEIKTVLRERSFPFIKLMLLDSTGKSAGALTEGADEADDEVCDSGRDGRSHRGACPRRS